jgi:hypothetical protein
MSLFAQYAVIHVMGPHSDMCSDDIIDYKNADIVRHGAPFTLWAQHSYAAKPWMIRALCKRGNVELYLIATPRKRTSYRMTGVQTRARHIEATEYSAGDCEPREWRPIAELGLGPVLDNSVSLTAARSYALVIGELQRLPQPEPISLANWADVGTGEPLPVVFRQGKHVICGERKDMSALPQMKSSKRVILAKAPLKPPYTVWLRAVLG